MKNADANGCVFCGIASGKIGASVVFEDDSTIAFVDLRQFHAGHTLVIPKSPARNLLDIAPDDLAYLIKTTQMIARATVAVFAADGLTIQQFNEPAGGQVVFHLHFHVIPRRNGMALKPPASAMEDQAVLADQASRLAAALTA